MVKLSPASLPDFLYGASELPVAPLQPVAKAQVPLENRHPHDLDEQTLLEALGEDCRSAFDELFTLAPKADSQLADLLKQLATRLRYGNLVAPSQSRTIACERSHTAISSTSQRRA